MYEQLLDIGNRETQEDCILVYKNIYLNEEYDVYCILDGHSGLECNNYFESNFIQSLKEYFSNNVGNTFEHNITRFFVNFDSKILLEEINSGCCVGIIFLSINNTKNYVTILGDVQAVIVNEKSVKITPMHNFNNKNELKRFKDSETKKVISLGKKTYKGLNVTRALGNKDLKDDLTKILSIPFVYSFSDYKCIYMYSDGIKLRDLQAEKYNVELKTLLNTIKEKYKYLDNISIIKITKDFKT